MPLGVSPVCDSGDRVVWGRFEEAHEADDTSKAREFGLGGGLVCGTGVDEYLSRGALYDSLLPYFERGDLEYQKLVSTFRKSRDPSSHLRNAFRVESRMRTIWGEKRRDEKKGDGQRYDEGVKEYPGSQYNHGWRQRTPVQAESHSA